MKSIKKTIVFVASILLLSLLVFPVAAQIGPVTGSDFGLPGGGGNGATEAQQFIQSIINVALTFVGLIALGFLIYGGFQYITAAGDEGKAESAKKTILYAIIGLIVIGLAAAVVNFVIEGFGGSGGQGAGGGDSGGAGVR